MQQTDKYKLNKPGIDDPLAIAPLNENMDKLEAAITAETAALDSRVTVLEAKYFVSGTFIGDGQSSQFINLGFTPKAVLVVGQDGSTHYNEGHAYHYGGLAITGGPSKTRDGLTVLSVEHNGFTVYYQSGGSNWLSYAHSNSSGRVYYYIAIG